MTCEEFEELSGAYVLDAVTPAERQTAEAHLATCQKCTSLLRELRQVVSLLSQTVPQIAPSPELKERILAAIREESQRTSRSMPQRPIPLTQVRRQRPSLRILIAAAVLIFALFSSLAAWNMSLQTQIVALQRQTTISNVASYPLQGSATGATGQLFYFAGQNITVLLIHGLPQLQGSHVYQGWLIHTKSGTLSSGIKDTTSIGLFNVKNGSASLSFEGNVSGYDATVISLEQGPFGTPKIPQGSIVAIGVLKHVANVKNNSASFDLLLLPFKTDEQLPLPIKHKA
jgi:anti-sigma-K factor RskA